MTTTAAARRRPRVFYGWYIVMAHMAVHFYLSVVFIYGMGAFLRPITTALGWTQAQYSLAAGLQRIEGSIASPVIGLLVDRVGPRAIVVTGVLLATVGMAALSRVEALWQFYAAYLLVALGMSGTIGIPFTASAANWFRRRRGMAMGLMFTGATFSGLFIPLLVMAIARWEWRTVMLWCAAGIVMVGLPASMVVRHRPEPFGYLPDGEEPPGAAESRGASGEALSRSVEPLVAPPGLTARQALRTRSFWLLTLVLGLASMGPGAMFLYQIPYFESIGFSPTLAATTVATFTMLSGIGRVGAGWLMDYVERRTVVVGLLLMNVVGFLVLAWTSQYWHTLVYALFFGISFGGMIPARPVLTAAYYGTRAFGAITGLLQSLAVVGGVVAPVLMGWVYDSTGTYRPAILALTAAVAVAIPLALALPSSRQERRTR